MKIVRKNDLKILKIVLRYSKNCIKLFIKTTLLVMKLKISYLVGICRLSFNEVESFRKRLRERHGMVKNSFEKTTSIIEEIFQIKEKYEALEQKGVLLRESALFYEEKLTNLITKAENALTEVEELIKFF